LLSALCKDTVARTTSNLDIVTLVARTSTGCMRTATGPARKSPPYLLYDYTFWNQGNCFKLCLCQRSYGKGNASSNIWYLYEYL